LIRIKTHRINRMANGIAIAPPIKYIRRSNRIQKIPVKKERKITIGKWKSHF